VHQGEGEEVIAVNPRAHFFAPLTCVCTRAF